MSIWELDQFQREETKSDVNTKLSELVLVSLQRRPAMPFSCFLCFSLPASPASCPIHTLTPHPTRYLRPASICRYAVPVLRHDTLHKPCLLPPPLSCFTYHQASFRRAGPERGIHARLACLAGWLVTHAHPHTHTLTQRDS